MDSTGFPNLEQLEKQVHNSIWGDGLIGSLFVVESADFVFLKSQTKLEDAGYVSVKKSFVGKRPQTMFKLTTILAR